MEDGVQAIPIWVEVAVALLGAFGGLEIVKFLYTVIFHRKSEHKKAAAEAKQKEAEASAQEQSVQDAWIANIKEEFEFNKTVASQLRQEYADLLAEKLQVKKDYKSVKANYALLARQVEGLQREMKRVMSVENEKKVHAESLICMNETCPKREPSKGTFLTPTEAPPSIDIEAIKIYEADRTKEKEIMEDPESDE